MLPEIRIEVCYPDVSPAEVLVLENMWRDRALCTRQRAVTAYLRRWCLPDEILALIASYTGSNMRGVDARRAHGRPGSYVIELCHVAPDRFALMQSRASF